MTTILIIVSISLLGSFLCSLFEATLYSVTPARVEEMRRKGGRSAQMLARLRARIDQPIAAILTVNTITHTMGATWAGALVGEMYGNLWVTWFSVIFTVAILFLTEIIPKTIGVVHANSLALPSAWPIQWMIWGVWPLVWVSQRVTERLSRRRKSEGPSEQEVLITADLALQAGRLLPQERRLILNALQLNDVKVRDLMTPRSVVEYLPGNLAVSEASARTLQLVHSRLPVTEDHDLDRIIGLVHRRQITEAAAKGDGARFLRELAQPLKFIPETTRANQLLEEFIQNRQHMACVVTEFGDVRGIITLEDVLECLLGQEIIDEFDRDVDMQASARRKARSRLLGR